MSIESLQPLQPILGPNAKTQVNSNQLKNNGLGFDEMLNNIIQEAESTAQVSAQMTDSLLAGEIDDLHSVTIAAEKADLSLNLVIQVRNKIVDAYNEIMRMQV